MGYTPDENTGVSRPKTFQEFRDDCTEIIKGAPNVLPGSPELTLAIRKAQECRMWLGVAEAMQKGLDPWDNRVEGGENDQATT